MNDTYENRKYLVSLKNELNFKFSFRDSKDILYDLHESTLDSSVTLLSRYGSPKSFFEEIQSTTPPARKNSLIKTLFLLTFIICIVFLNIINDSIPPTLYIFLTAILYLFLSNDSCLIGIVKATRKEYFEYIIVQLLLFFCCLFIQAFILFGLPNLIHTYSLNSNKLFTVCNIVQYIYQISFFIFFLFILFSFYCYLLKQKIWMFGILIQGIGAIASFSHYVNYLTNITTIEIKPYIMIPYYLSLIFSIIWFLIFTDIPQYKTFLNGEKR